MIRPGRGCALAGRTTTRVVRSSVTDRSRQSPYTPWVSHHVIAVAESDSYLKWAVSLLAQLPASSKVEIVVARSPVRPSPNQRIAALSGTAFANHEPEVLSPFQLLRKVERDRPDAVLLACTGPSAHAYQEALGRATYRPVLLAGIPGIALPARRRAWGYRGAVDLFVVHSRREVGEYDRVRMLMGKTGRVGLATIPFLAPARAAIGSNLNSVSAQAGSVQLRQSAQTARKPGNRVLFATQAKVPRVRRERVEILLALDRLATARPDLEVVVKTRGLSGEFHTHHEAHHYADLWKDLVSSGQVRAADSLVFAAGSMAEQLEDALALVTVSSTAVLEAMALDLPVLLLDEFGISEGMINQVFVGSGCLGGLDALCAADFRHPEKWWLSQNYFHPAADNTWIGMLDELVVAAAAGQLPAVLDGLDAGRTARRRRMDRLRLTQAGSALARARHRLKKQLRRTSRQRSAPVVQSS
jgi:putative glycosyltransferase DUF6716